MPYCFDIWHTHVVQNARYGSLNLATKKRMRESTSERGRGGGGGGEACGFLNSMLVERQGCSSSVVLSYSS